jgi:hypothetical protein
MINGPEKNAPSAGANCFNQTSVYIAVATDAVMAGRRVKMSDIIRRFKNQEFCIDRYTKELHEILMEEGLMWTTDGYRGRESYKGITCASDVGFLAHGSKINSIIVEDFIEQYYLENSSVYHNQETDKQKEKIKVKTHMDICKELTDLYERKNADYGDSFARLRNEIPDAILVRIYDKYSRLKTLMNGNEQQVKDESIDDTLIDLANYCILELIERRTNGK